MIKPSLEVEKCRKPSMKNTNGLLRNWYVVKEFREGIPKQVLNQQMGKICVRYGRLNNLESGFLKVAVRLCVCVCICVDGVLKIMKRKTLSPVHIHRV